MFRVELCGTNADPEMDTGEIANDNQTLCPLWRAIPTSAPSSSSNVLFRYDVPTSAKAKVAAREAAE